MNRKKSANIIVHIILLIGTVIMIVSFIWMALTSSIIYIMFQKQFIEGIATSGGKL